MDNSEPLLVYPNSVALTLRVYLMTLGCGIFRSMPSFGRSNIFFELLIKQFHSPEVTDIIFLSSLTCKKKEKHKNEIIQSKIIPLKL